MKRRYRALCILLILALGMFALASGVSAADQSYKVTKAAFTIRLNEDGSADVTEVWTARSASGVNGLRLPMDGNRFGFAWTVAGKESRDSRSAGTPERVRKELTIVFAALVGIIVLCVVIVRLTTYRHNSKISSRAALGSEALLERWRDTLTPLELCAEFVKDHYALIYVCLAEAVNKGLLKEAEGGYEYAYREGDYAGTCYRFLFELLENSKKIRNAGDGKKRLDSGILTEIIRNYPAACWLASEQLFDFLLDQLMEKCRFRYDVSKMEVEQAAIREAMKKEYPAPVSFGDLCRDYRQETALCYLFQRESAAHGDAAASDPAGDALDASYQLFISACHSESDK